MISHSLISNATVSPLPVGDGLGVRSITKRQIQVTMSAAGVGTLEGLKVGKLLDSKTVKLYEEGFLMASKLRELDTGRHEDWKVC